MARRKKEQPKPKLSLAPLPIKQPEPESDQVQAFLKKKDCFFCTKMSATLSHRTCVLRQLPKVVQRSAYTPQFKDSPPDAYCRSGQCAQGNANKAAWEAKHGPMQPPVSTRIKRPPKLPEEDDI